MRGGDDVGGGVVCRISAAEVLSRSPEAVRADARRLANGRLAARRGSSCVSSSSSGGASSS
jgi:hypothetical protein